MTTYADTLIFNAAVITLNAGQAHAQSVALKDGKILAIGTDDALFAMRGPSTRLIDAMGNTVLPGFSENHMHIFTGAAELDHLQLGGVHGLETLNEAIRAYAAARPHQSVLFAQGADYAILGPDESLDRHRLDAILKDQALLISAPDHHTSWANTKALEMGGILHGRELNVGNEIVARMVWPLACCWKWRPSGLCNPQAGLIATGLAFQRAASLSHFRTKRPSRLIWM